RIRATPLPTDPSQQPESGPDVRRPQRDGADTLPSRRGDTQDVGGTPPRPFHPPDDLARAGRTLRRTVRRQGTEHVDRTGLILSTVILRGASESARPAFLTLRAERHHCAR